MNSIATEALLMVAAELIRIRQLLECESPKSAARLRLADGVELERVRELLGMVRGSGESPS